MEREVSLSIDSEVDESPPSHEKTDSISPPSVDIAGRMDIADEAEAADEADRAVLLASPIAPARQFSWKRTLIYGVLPAIALVLALAAGYLKWQDDSALQSQSAAAQSVAAATESTVAMLAYRPDTVDRDLPAAADRLTGTFREDYTKLIDEVVLPGAKEKLITVEATVPAAASISATENHAEVLVFVNQTTTIGDGAPTSSISSVRVTLDKIDDRWLISQFEPV